MLFSQYFEITLNYFLLAFLISLGTLQWVAARHQKSGLNLLGPWGNGWPGQGLGLLMVVASFTNFFLTTPGLFSPGLAGGELSLLFGAGGGCALLGTRLAGAWWQKIYGE
jgi:hypothetical protein